jgi:hypothetical protein
MPLSGVFITFIAIISIAIKTYPLTKLARY